MGVKYTYNNLDWFIPWYLDDYLVLNKQQEDDFDIKLAALWQWHRQHELPQYSQLLKEIVKDLDEDTITLERLHYYSENSRRFFKEVLIKAIEQGGPFLANLNEQQLVDMFDALAESDEEFKQEVAEMDQAERIKKRRNSVSKLFRKWIGKLSEKQKLLVEDWSVDAETTLEFQLQQGQASREAFKKAMAERHHKPLTRQRLIELTTQPELLQSEEYKEVIERNRVRFRQLMIATLDTLSNKQQSRLRKKILNYAEDFSQLSAQ